MKLILIIISFFLTFNTAQAQIDGPMVFVDQIKSRETKGKNGAVFMNILNNEGDEWNLISASTDICDHVELHTHIQEGDVFRMRSVKEISLNPGTVTELKPGGLHVMLIGLKKELKAGDEFQLILKFSNGKQTFMLDISVPVQKLKGCGCSHKH